MSIPEVELSNGVKIPQFGLGTWQVTDNTQYQTMFDAAVAAGYRHFDTAQIYNNEQLLGAAWQSAGLKRQDIFITTKIFIKNFGPKRLKSSFAESLNKLSIDQSDLLLLHFPVTILRKNAWRALEQLYAEGKTRAIGVSNYTIKHLEEMKDYAETMPHVNQVELHVFLQQPELLQYCRQNGIVVEAYSPLAHAKANDESVIQEIAAAHGKTYAQIMLRWCVEQGLVVIPKSITPSRIQENAEIFSFKLTPADLEKLATLDRDFRTCWSPVHIP
ncbi:MAG: aldo/keto reductase [Candidatus Saccharimonadales bacterium]